MSNLLAWVKGFVPAPINARKREKLYACVGACIGIMFTEWISKTVLGDLNPWFVAPMGASAVLLFALPSSPLAQPWSIIGGNLVSALIGITCAKLISNPALAAGVAAGLAIGAMISLRCLHPPSGAVALTAVLGGRSVIASGYHFALHPVAVNSVFLVAAALVFNNLLRRRYPHPVAGHKSHHQTGDPRPGERLGFTRADLDETLKTYDEMLDINEDDLEEILLQAESRAFQRRSGEIRCADIMSKDVVVVHPAVSIASAWKLLANHNIHALPVVNLEKKLAGIVTLHDLIEVPDENEPQDMALPRPSNAQRLKDVMTRKVQTVAPDQPITNLISLLADGGFQHLPVVDSHRHVVGMITRSDMIAALYRLGLEAEMKNSTNAAKNGRIKLVKV
jgi:CBS domain-containing membrane protein